LNELLDPGRRLHRPTSEATRRVLYNAQPTASLGRARKLPDVFYTLGELECAKEFQVFRSKRIGIIRSFAKLAVKIGYELID
jgi:hypothetical protein